MAVTLEQRKQGRRKRFRCFERNVVASAADVKPAILKSCASLAFKPLVCSVRMYDSGRSNRLVFATNCDVKSSTVRGRQDALSFVGNSQFKQIYSPACDSDIV